MHRFGLLIVAALFLASCGGSPSAPATTTTSPSAQASAQPSAAPSSSPSAAPSSAASAEPSPSADAEASAEASPDTGSAEEGVELDVLGYATAIQSPLTGIGEGLTGFATLFTDPKLEDAAWKAEVIAEMDKIRKGHEDLTKLNPPAEAEPAHEQLLTATSDCNQATDKISSGLDTNNVTEIGEASTLIISCGTKLQTAQQMILELAPQ